MEQLLQHSDIKKALNNTIRLLQNLVEDEKREDNGLIQLTYDARLVSVALSGIVNEFYSLEDLI